MFILFHILKNKTSSKYQLQIYKIRQKYHYCIYTLLIKTPYLRKQGDTCLYYYLLN